MQKTENYYIELLIIHKQIIIPLFPTYYNIEKNSNYSK